VSHGREEELKVLDFERKDAKVEGRVTEDQSVGQDVGQMYDRYGHNIMSALQIHVESTDRRLEAISALVANGVISNMDSKAVNSILSSLIN